MSDKNHSMPERIWMRDASWPTSDRAIEETDGGDPVGFEYIRRDIVDDLYAALVEALILIPTNYETADKARAALAKSRASFQDEAPSGQEESSND